MFRIIFIHSSVDGRLGGFHVLAIVNGLAVFLRVCIPYLFFAKSHMHCRYGDFGQCPGEAFVTPGIAIPLYLLGPVGEIGPSDPGLLFPRGPHHLL